MITRWVLVAGTGKSVGLTNIEVIFAEEIGRLLAEQGFGLVVGGWPGVDHVTARAYANTVRLQNIPLADGLIQVVAEHRPVIYPAGAEYPDFKGGYIITVPQGVREWIEAIKYADAVILLGGEGATFEMYHYSLQEQRPVFPISATSGDAAAAFSDSIDRWEILPFSGIDKAEYIETLSPSISDRQQAICLVEKTIKILSKRFDYEDNDVSENRPVFISYAHEDRHWLNKLRSALRPLEKTVNFSIWDDTSLKPSKVFETEIKRAINDASIAILLVSDSFCVSEYIQHKELPWLLTRQEAGDISIFWIPVQGESWKTSILSNTISAMGDVDVPLCMLTSAEQQDAMVVVRHNIARAIAVAQSTKP